MVNRVGEDIKAWRGLGRLMPGWKPTLQGLRKLDVGPSELLVALRSIARGWDRNDARWDVLQAVLEYTKQQHAHELAKRVRRHACSHADAGAPESFLDGMDAAAEYIKPEAGDG